MGDKSNRANGNEDPMNGHSRTNSKTSNNLNKKSETNASISSLTSRSFGSRSTDSIEESPKKRFGKWNKSVKLGSGTKTFLNKLKSNSTTSDKTAEDKKNTQAPANTTTEKEAETESCPAKNSSWSEHVWSTFIHRGYSDDVTEKVPLVAGKELLTDFRIHSV